MARPAGAKDKTPRKRRGHVVLKETEQALQRRIARAQETLMPADVMLDNMTFYANEYMVLQNERDAAGKVLDLEEWDKLNGKMLEFRKLAQEAARDCAPYYHPKLASMTLQKNEKKTVVLNFMGVDPGLSDEAIPTDVYDIEPLDIDVDRLPRA